MTSPSPDAEHVIVELSKHPPPLLAAFEEARPAVEDALGVPQALHWAQDGVHIAQQTARAWEAAAEYFRAGPRVTQVIGYPQLERWVEGGIELCQESPSIASSYFRASPGVLAHLAPRHIAGWAAMGRGLSRGTWKSSSLAARFFDSSPELTSALGFREMQLFTSLVEALSYRSYDLAAECLNLGHRVLPTVTEREALISLASSLVDSSWREVRGVFEAAARVSSSIDPKLRNRYFALTEELARLGMGNVSTFMLETTQAMARLPSEHHAQVLDRAQGLADHSVEAVGAFLRTAPNIMERISPTQVDVWYAQGMELLRENPDGGVAYFKLESSRSEKVLDLLSSAIELEKVKQLLTLYSNALAGSEVELQPANELTQKNIGWVTVERATTDGSHVYLPPMVDRHATKDENFSWLKVVATHQVGHIEFGSFQFDFQRPAAQFTDLRPQLAAELLPNRAATDMAHFFDLFPNRALAADIFSVVEDARIDFGLGARYRGLAKSYRQVQSEALETRPPIQQMPLQQAMAELLIRLSLHQVKEVPVPKAYVAEARELAALLRQVQAEDATVEDTAEATVRMYHIISQLPNEEVPPEDWQTEDLEDGTFDEQDPDDVLQQLRQQGSGEGEETEEDYESPEDVDYRGDFKPEMVQLLSRMRGQGDDPTVEMDALSQEELEELLRETAEVDFGEEADLAQIANNLLRESAATQKPKSAGAGYSHIPHQEEGGGALEPTEPRSYVYDEWDFRANDYRPRWCMVQEKQVLAGDTRFFSDTLQANAGLMDQIRRQFEAIRPEMYRKIKHLPEGDDVDLDAAIEALIDLRGKHSPDERLYWRRNKAERDVGVVFLLDMSASTAEAVEEARRGAEWDVPGDPVAYTMWLRTRRGEGVKRQYKRIIDVEKESMVLLMTALEAIGDRYGVYGFSGFGRENVEFYVIKEMDEHLSDGVKRRLDKVAPLHATRMGPAIRHATTKLEALDAKTKFLFVVSDGRPQDRGYSREGVEKEYAVQDTRMALLEARQKDITPFCLTVDREGHDYLRTMAGDMGYEVVPDIMELPRRLPALYRRLTV